MSGVHSPASSGTDIAQIPQCRATIDLKLVGGAACALRSEGRAAAGVRTGHVSAPLDGEAAREADGHECLRRSRANRPPPEPFLTRRQGGTHDARGSTSAVL